MAQDDFYIEAGRQRLAVLEAARTAALADLQAHKVNGDRDAAAEAVQTIANLDVEMQNLGGLYQRYQQSVNPPLPPEPSAEERAARPINRMDWQDVTNLARTSKYARDIRPDDPNLIAGYQEAMRRKARGE
jgi:hypothetical protein